MIVSDNEILEEDDDVEDTETSPTRNLAKGLPREVECTEYARKIVHQGFVEYCASLRRAEREISQLYSRSRKETRQHAIDDAQAVKSIVSLTDVIVAEAQTAKRQALKGSPKERFVTIGKLEDLVGNIAKLIHELRSPVATEKKEAT